MLSEIFETLGQLLQSILSMFGLVSDTPSLGMALVSNGIRIYIKHGVGQTAIVDLDPTWSMRKVKEIAAPQLGLKPEEIKLIFAGKELSDELILQSCDVGQQSFLHAVRVQIKQKSSELKESDESNTNENKESSMPDSSSSSSYHSIISEELSHNQSLSPLSDSEIFPPHNHSANTQSDFFVYCNTCQNLQEGKLRVRCALCLSGAFTVLRDPEGWDDVLKPNQVPGSCETPDCPSNFAQFYFKCSAHITSGEDDSSSPLPQVKRNPDSIPCLACGESKNPVFVFLCPDTHVTCIECFQQFTLVKINQRQFILDPTLGYTLGCPVLCENSLIKDTHHFKLMGKHHYDRYQRFAAEEYVLREEGGVLCPQPDCGMGIIPVDVSCNKIACIHGCGYVFCRLCLEGWHIGNCSRDGSLPTASGSSTSTAYPLTRERVALAQWEDESRRAIRVSFKPCPQCRVVTERAGGCMHMECVKCSLQWCWICQNKWTRECMGNHWFGCGSLH